MKKKLAILPALALGLLPLAAVVPTAHAATGDLTTVSITVSMDLPSVGNTKTALSDGPIVYEVTDVPVAAGPELTGADLVSNPSDWEGSVTVDVDNTTHTITVATEDSANFETATVTVTGEGLGPITLVSDDLWEARQPAGLSRTPATTPEGMPLTYSSADGTATMDWTADPEGVSFDLATDGSAIFSWTVVAPTTIAPTTTAPPAAAPAVEAQPAFTG